MSRQVYLALGTNLGNRLENLQAAQQELADVVRNLVCSPVYETPPWGVLDQPAFLNMVVTGEPGLNPMALLHFLKDLEKRLGRQPGVRYGPRLIDLDILFYADWIIDEPGLTIPHPRLAERAFVLAPLADLAPDLVHPVLQQTVSQLLSQVDRTGITLFVPQTLSPGD